MSTDDTPGRDRVIRIVTAELMIENPDRSESDARRLAEESYDKLIAMKELPL